MAEKHVQQSDAEKIRRINTRGEYGSVYFASYFKGFNLSYASKLLAAFEKEGTLVRISIRNALVRANYSNLQKGITETTVYLERFFRSMLLGEEGSFRNRELHIEWKEATDADSAQSANETVQTNNEV